jgi:phenylpropionate dioxygenase-like ring-hydroxylating dioxygenase large terminal subunit
MVNDHRLGPVAALVENDRVHRRCYTDPALFELELERIFESTWIYCGHETQVPRRGDYVAVRIGRQPMIMVRGERGAIHVHYNRCPHRGPKLCGADQGHAGDALICPYHAWRFALDGRCQAIPLASGYDGTRLSKEAPEASLRSAPCVANYRGFVFARLVASGPSLAEWLGPARVAIDDLCDRAPDGEVEVVQPRFRMIQRSNWKLFMENQLDALHAPITHESAGRAAVDVEGDIERRTGVRPTTFLPLSAVTIPLDRWDALRTLNYPYGHGVLEAYLPRATDRDTLAYEALMRDRYGSERSEQILSRGIHHVLLYPCVSVQPNLQQLRVIRPLAVDRTLTELWHFRLKGAPEPIYRRALDYFNLINSPSTLVNADDLENWTRAQQGLASRGLDWVSFHRNHGGDEEREGVVISRQGTSEAPMRNQFQAWLRYVTAEAHE